MISLAHLPGRRTFRTFYVMYESCRGGRGREGGREGGWKSEREREGGACWLSTASVLTMQERGRGERPRLDSPPSAVLPRGPVRHFFQSLFSCVSSLSRPSRSDENTFLEAKSKVGVSHSSRFTD